MLALPSLSKLHTGLTICLALCLGALYAQNQRLSDREVQSVQVLTERDMSIKTLTQQLTDTKQRADDLERSTQVTETTDKLPSGEVKTTRVVQTKVSDKSEASEVSATATREQVTTSVQKTETKVSSSAPAAPDYSVTAWRTPSGWGGTAGIRLGGMPAWAEAGYLQGQGYLLGLRVEL